MNVTTYIIMVFAFLLGVLVAWLVLRRKLNREQEGESPSIASASDQSNALQQDKRLEAKIDTLNADIVSLKEKHKQAIEAANAQIKELEGQLANALNGNVDAAVGAQLEEVKKLKKQISDLEEEIEDYEDDIDDLKKKLRNKTAENTELQESIDKITREVKQLTKDVECTQNDLALQKKENEQNSEALAFVAEVLQATTVSDENKKTLFQNVDSLVAYVRNDLKDCIKDSLNEETNKWCFGAELDAWATNKKKSWIQGKTTIALVGEFSAGKTSIVNRILSQDEKNVTLLPVSTKATTAIPTYISGGVGTMFMFVSPDNEQKNISEETFKRVNKEVLDRVEGLSSLIKYFVMTYKNPNLNNLSILDTPGFNSNDKEDAERTIEVINECDALFWVVDVNTGTVNRSSLKLIKENLTKPLYVVINKIDTKAKSEVDAVQNLIAKTFKEEGVPVKGFVRFSAKANLDDIMSIVKSVQRDTTKDIYMDDLLELVKQLKDNSNKDVLDAEQECNRLLKSCNKITDKFNKALNRLGSNCEKAADIPHFEEHLFRKDNYEMSQDEYGNLIDVLNEICQEDCSKLASIYDEQSEEVGKLNDAWSAYAELCTKSDKLENNYEQLNKKYNNLNKTTHGK